MNDAEKSAAFEKAAQHLATVPVDQITPELLNELFEHGPDFFKTYLHALLALHGHIRSPSP